MAMDLKPCVCSLYLDVQAPKYSWKSEAGSAPSADWIDRQSIYGTAQIDKPLYAVRGGGAQTTLIERAFVTIYPKRGGQAEKLVSMMSAPSFSSMSYLSHHEARAATREDRAVPDETFLTITIPDEVFDRVWRELDSGQRIKALHVGVLAYCFAEQHWMQQYYIHAGSLNVVEPTGVSVIAGLHQSL